MSERKEIDLNKNNFRTIIMTVADFQNLSDEQKMLVARNYMRQLISENNKDINHILLQIATFNKYPDTQYVYPRIMSDFGKLFLFCGSKNLDYLYNELDMYNAHHQSHPKKMVDYMDLYTLYCFNEVQKHFLYDLSNMNKQFFDKSNRLSEYLNKSLFPKFINRRRDVYPAKYSKNAYMTPKWQHSSMHNYDKVFFDQTRLDYDTASIEGNKVIIKGSDIVRNTLKERRVDDFDYLQNSITPSRVETHIQMYIKAYLAKVFSKDLKLPASKQILPHQVLVDFYPQDMTYNKKVQQYTDFKEQNNPYFVKYQKQSTAQKERRQKEMNYKEMMADYYSSENFLEFGGKKYLLATDGKRYVTSSDEQPLDHWISTSYDELFTYPGTKNIYLGEVKEGVLTADGEYEYFDHPYGEDKDDEPDRDDD